MKGQVTKSTGSWYTVKYNDNNFISCKLKGNFKIKGIRNTNPITIGDYVDFIILPDNSTGLITTLHKRNNYIIRKSKNLSKQTHIIASNINQAILIITIKNPKTSTSFIDRFLITTEAYSIPALIIINKTDLLDNDDKNLKRYNQIISMYQNIGYNCIGVSSFNNDDIEKLKQKLINKTNLFTGHSGVGKSTLINKIEPSLSIKTGEISEYHKKGTHTTTYYEMYPLSFGGYIIDTPGIKEFGIFDFRKEEIGHYYPEIRSIMNNCKFNDCTHVHEPECAIKDALENNKIHAERYKNYLGILNNEDLNEEY